MRQIQLKPFDYFRCYYLSKLNLNQQRKMTNFPFFVLLKYIVIEWQSELLFLPLNTLMKVIIILNKSRKLFSTLHDQRSNYLPTKKL